MCKVYFVEPPKVGTGNASEFGEVQYIFIPGVKRASQWSEKFLEEVDARLTEIEFDYTNDFFVSSGNQMQVVRVLSLLQSRYGRVKVLFFSPPDQSYRELMVGMNGGCTDQR